MVYSFQPEVCNAPYEIYPTLCSIYIQMRLNPIHNHQNSRKLKDGHKNKRAHRQFAVLILYCTTLKLMSTLAVKTSKTAKFIHSH